MMTYHVVHGRQTNMPSKEGWYIKETDGITRIIDCRYETESEAKAAADRLTKMEAEYTSK